MGQGRQPAVAPVGGCGGREVRGTPVPPPNQPSPAARPLRLPLSDSVIWLDFFDFPSRVMFFCHSPLEGESAGQGRQPAVAPVGGCGGREVRGTPVPPPNQPSPAARPLRLPVKSDSAIWFDFFGFHQGKVMLSVGHVRLFNHGMIIGPKGLSAMPADNRQEMESGYCSDREDYWPEPASRRAGHRSETGPRSLPFCYARPP